MILSTENKKTLICIARDEIVSHLRDEGKKTDEELPRVLRTKCGAFVSIYVHDKLRGCIGTFSEEEPLVVNVKRMALSAALKDSRFTPISGEEIDQINIEISVLSPRKKIEGPGEIEIGRHGIFIERGLNRGTLLPQVAVNQGWTVEELLGNCSKYKAGLGWNGWKTAKLFTYEATVFNSDTAEEKC